MKACCILDIVPCVICANHRLFTYACVLVVNMWICVCIAYQGYDICMWLNMCLKYFVT
jgi:hypothetical protein